MVTPLDCALGYAALGYAVFPVVMPSKRPAIARWQEIASTDGGQLSEWWARWPGAAVGLAHRLTGTLALDIDSKPERNGYQTLLCHRLAGHDDPPTVAFRTASGGAQRILARPADLAGLSGNYPGALGAGLDVILGYSVLPTGGATPGRVWNNDPVDCDPAACPDWIIATVRAKQETAAALESLPRPPMPTDLSAGYRYAAAAIDGEVEAIRALAPGGLQDGLHRAAGNVGRALARAGRGDLAGYAADVLASAAPWCNTAHERATICRAIAWGLNHGE